MLLLVERVKDLQLFVLEILEKFLSMDDKGGGFQFFDGLLVEKGHFEKGEEGEEGAGGRFSKDDIKGRS